MFGFLSELLERVKKHPRVWLAILTFAIGWAGSRLIDYWTNDWLSAHVWKPLKGALTWLVEQPVGYVLLVVLLWLVVLVTAAWMESTRLGTWIARKIGRKRPRKPTWEQRQEIQKIRAFWNL